jgi:hypothetical protein
MATANTVDPDFETDAGHGDKVGAREAMTRR